MLDLKPSISASVQSLIPQVAAARESSERERRLPAALVQAMVDARLFRMWVPKALGGDEVDLVTGLEAIEALAQADGSAAWVATNFIGWSSLSGYLSPDAAREIVGPPDAAVGGSTNTKPGTKALALPGGYRLSGRWGFGSGVHHATWMGLLSPVWDNDAPRTTDAGVPVARFFFVPRSAIDVQDTWFVSGMRGTGSEEFIVSDLFVPEERTLPLPPEPSDVSTLHRIPVRSQFPLCGGIVPLGIARTAIAALVELAGTKVPAGATKLLREREAVQADVARAEALVRTSRAFFYESARDLWETAERGDPISVEQRALGRLAATSSTLAATQAVDLMYGAGGTTSLFESCPLERCFRDIHAVAQGALISTPSLDLIGKVLLGMDLGSALL